MRVTKVDCVTAVHLMGPGCVGRCVMKLTSIVLFLGLLCSASAEMHKPDNRRTGSVPPAVLGQLHDIQSLERTQIADSVAHYQFELRLGPGEFDVVRVHRVIREDEPYHPVRTNGAIFMVHGANNTFDMVFLRPGIDDPTAETASSVYLATNGIDVWGIDLAWNRVPLETTDFSFMQGWGLERDARDTVTAMSLARLIRGLTGQDFGPMNLLGYSYGNGVAYTAASLETQIPDSHRHIRGLITLDHALKVGPEDEDFRLAACDTARTEREELEDGLFNSANLRAAVFGNLAATAPDEPSSLIPGFTNFQAALLIGIRDRPFWHFVGGESNEQGIPVGLLYSEPARWIVALRVLPPHMPKLARFESNVVRCDNDDEFDVSADDHLSEISVPILFLAGAGGFGKLGSHTAARTASTEVTNHIVQLQADEDRSIDYGHLDLLMGDEAPVLVWEVLRQWLVDH